MAGESNLERIQGRGMQYRSQLVDFFIGVGWPDRENLQLQVRIMVDESCWIGQVGFCDAQYRGDVGVIGGYHSPLDKFCVRLLVYGSRHYEQSIAAASSH